MTGNAYIYGSLSHSGQTVVSAGTLAIGTGTLNSTPLVTVTNTGTLAGVGPIGAPVTVASTTVQSAHLRMGMSPLNLPATLTINNNVTLGVGSELDIKLGTATTTGGGVNDLLVVNGNLTINPNAYLNIVPLQPLTTGTYVIATYTGTLTGQFTNTITSLSRYGFTLDYSTAGQIKLNVTGSGANLVWQGATNTTWNVLGTSNWLNGASADVFDEGDAITFNDTATNFNVVLAATLYPASITFNNNSNYSLTGSGSGRISGGTGITKSGNGTVLMAAGLGVGNDYTGPVQINGGIFKMNGALSLGATNGGTTVASGATLDINGQTAGSEPITLQGAGFNGTNGAINNSSGTAPSQSGGPRIITLAGDTTINASGARWDIGNNTLGVGGGSFAGNGHTLTKIGVNDIWLHELGDIGVGNIFVNQGLLGFEYTIGMGNPANTITVASGASLGIFHAASALSKNVVLNNGATINSSGDAGTSNALSSTITLSGTNTINNNGFPLDLGGVIGGTGGFQKSGSGLLYLEAANTYSGPTLVNAGRIVFGSGGSIGNSSLINLAAGTSLDASAPAGGLVLGTGQTLTGFGGIAGDATANGGSIITPGSSLIPFTMGFSNNLTLNGGTCNIKLSGDPFTIGGGVNDLLWVGNNLTLSGTTTIQVAPIAALSGNNPYTIAQYGGTLSGGAVNLHVISSNPRYIFNVVDPATTPPYIQVSVGGNSASLVWRGGKAPNPSAWDHTTSNWFNTATSAFDLNFNGDLAIFDDTATTNIVNIVGTNNAGATIMSNNAAAFTFVGGGLLTGPVDMEGTSSLVLTMSNAPAFTGITLNSGALVFQLPGGATNKITAPISDNGLGQGIFIQGGTNTLVLSADNSFYTGAIAITNGVLQYTNASCLGATASPLYATNGGTLDINALVAGPKNIIISGGGYNGKGAVTSSSTAALANAGLNNLALAGDASIGAQNRWDVFQNSFNGNGFKLTEVGPGSNLLIDDGETSIGDLHIVAGRLGFQGNVTMGDPAKTATVEAGGTLTFFSATNSSNPHNGEDKLLVLKGGAVFDSGGASNNFNGPVFLTGTNLMGTRSTLHLWGNISDINGPGGILLGSDSISASGGDLYLDGVNTYTGPTIITNRTLFVGPGSSLGASSLIQINSGAKLDVTALATFQLGAGQKLIGNGTVAGNSIVFASGATLAPGLGGNNTAALTMNGSLSLQSGSTNAIVVNKTGGIANSTVSGLTSVSMSGTLVINSVGNPLASGDAIPLFSASGSYAGSFDSIIPSTPGAGLLWNTSTLNSDGKLRVSSSVNPNPTNVVFSLSGSQLTFSWPDDHKGWTLQAQTNGFSGTWYDVPASTTTNQIFMQVDPANIAVFYRLVLHQ